MSKLLSRNVPLLLLAGLFITFFAAAPVWAASQESSIVAQAGQAAQQVVSQQAENQQTEGQESDISAVNPSAMSPWRLEQLWLLYMATYNELTRELETDRIHESRADTPEKAAFLEGFPVRYLRTHSDEEINQHLALERADAG